MAITSSTVAINYLINDIQNIIRCSLTVL